MKIATILFDVQTARDTKDTARQPAGATVQIPQRLALEFARQHVRGAAARKAMYSRYIGQVKRYPGCDGRLAGWTVTIVYASGRTRVVREFQD
jgi:hypothetical protein